MWSGLFEKGRDQGLFLAGRMCCAQPVREIGLCQSELYYILILLGVPLAALGSGCCGDCCKSPS